MFLVKAVAPNRIRVRNKQLNGSWGVDCLKNLYQRLAWADNSQSFRGCPILCTIQQSHFRVKEYHQNPYATLHSLVHHEDMGSMSQTGLSSSRHWLCLGNPAGYSFNCWHGSR